MSAVIEMMDDASERHNAAVDDEDLSQDEKADAFERAFKHNLTLGKMRKRHDRFMNSEVCRRLSIKQLFA